MDLNDVKFIEKPIVISWLIIPNCMAIAMLSTMTSSFGKVLQHLPWGKSKFWDTILDKLDPYLDLDTSMQCMDESTTNCKGACCNHTYREAVPGKFLGIKSRSTS